MYKDKKLQILALLPDSWNNSKIMEHFDTNRRLIRIARELKKGKGILATPASKKGLLCQISIKKNLKEILLITAFKNTYIKCED